jgi:hypothetical protein
MHFLKAVSAIALLAILVGCYPREAAYNAASIEQPQPVDYFYGTVVEARNVTVEYWGALNWGNNDVTPRWRPRGRGSLYIPFGVFAEALLPNLPAIEYTVIVEANTFPPDPFLKPDQLPAVIVVQNEYPGAVLPVNTPVFVRVAGGSGRVTAAASLPQFVNLPNGTTVDVYRNLRAGPLPIPLSAPFPPSFPPAATACNSCNKDHPSWTIPGF